MILFDMSLNKEFRVVFQPKNPEEFGGRRRFAIGAGSVAKYIGEENAKTAIEKAVQSTQDCFKKKFRTHGQISFYVK